MADKLAFLRRFPRLAVALPARLRSPGGPAEPVTITDISEHGCRIESWVRNFNVGDGVIVRPQGLEPLMGEVRWVKGHRFGVRFGRPLYAPVVEHLHRTHAFSGGLKLVA